MHAGTTGDTFLWENLVDTLFVLCYHCYLLYGLLRRMEASGHDIPVSKNSTFYSILWNCILHMREYA